MNVKPQNATGRVSSFLMRRGQFSSNRGGKRGEGGRVSGWAGWEWGRGPCAPALPCWRAAPGPEKQPTPGIILAARRLTHIDVHHFLLWLSARTSPPRWHHYTMCWPTEFAKSMGDRVFPWQPPMSINTDIVDVALMHKAEPGSQFGS